MRLDTEDISPPNEDRENDGKESSDDSDSNNEEDEDSSNEDSASDDYDDESDVNKEIKNYLWRVQGKLHTSTRTFDVKKTILNTLLTRPQIHHAVAEIERHQLYVLTSLHVATAIRQSQRQDIIKQD